MARASAPSPEPRLFRVRNQSSTDSLLLGPVIQRNETSDYGHDIGVRQIVHRRPAKPSDLAET